ncbi:hypothetical protein [Reinekea blandensis]|uniref:Uncharacterized protein n=1 Tax=Reinekea blandensis MED297 TaxID=314283 RepID=A4BJE9_9GAMM|nr:hypothetical protein [Reinekea blandensis]EAR07721.1 hypothetical protein MED297_01940 [Reinekea sp. MED297] [Reinekea blandensis MED297]
MPKDTHELMFQLLRMNVSPMTFVSCKQVNSRHDVTAFINGWRPMPESVKAFCRDWIAQGKPDYRKYVLTLDSQSESSSSD